jgi:CTP synthase (UTP-ammonia lyase)
MANSHATTPKNRRKSAAAPKTLDDNDLESAIVENLESDDPPISAFAEVAAQYDLPIWAMVVPGTTRDMFEDISKMKRLIKLVSDYLDCPDSWRSNVEDLAAGFAEINRNVPAARAATAVPS